MNNGFKTKIVEPQQNVAVVDAGPPSDEELAAKAVEEIRSTERLSGFGRFATKLQNFFQASKPAIQTTSTTSEGCSDHDVGWLIAPVRDRLAFPAVEA